MYCSCCGEVIEEDVDEDTCDECTSMLNGDEVDVLDPEDLDTEVTIL